MRIGRAKISSCARHILEFLKYYSLDSPEKMFGKVISANIQNNGFSGEIISHGEKSRVDVFYKLQVGGVIPLRLTIDLGSEKSYDSRIVIRTYQPYSTYAPQGREIGLFGNAIVTRRLAGGMPEVVRELRALQSYTS